MIPEHDTDTDELLDADDTSGEDDKPLLNVHKCSGLHGHGIRTLGGRGSVIIGRARQGDNPNWTWEKINQTQDKDDIETIPIFSKNEGLHIRIGDTPNVLDFVELYLTDGILTHVVNETNRYGHQYLEENPEKADNHYISAWTDTGIL